MNHFGMELLDIGATSTQFRNIASVMSKYFDSLLLNIFRGELHKRGP